MVISLVFGGDQTTFTVDASPVVRVVNQIEVPRGIELDGCRGLVEAKLDGGSNKLLAGSFRIQRSNVTEHRGFRAAVLRGELFRVLESELEVVVQVGHDLLSGACWYE